MSDQVAPNSAPQGTDPMAMPYATPVQPYYGEYAPTFSYSGMYSPYPMPYAYTYPTAFPDQLLMDKLLKQIEYYFSENNLASDGYLISQMDSDFLVPIDVIANFNRVRYLTQNIMFVIQAMKSSANLIVQEEIMKVGPILKFPRKTLVVRSSPAFEKEEIEKVFASENIPGPVVRSDLKDVWFVEFENDESVLQAFEVIQKQQSETRRVTAFVKAENISVPTPLRDMMQGNPVPASKGYGGVPNVYAPPAFPYYGMMPGWRPPQMAGYGYPPQTYDAYGAQLRPPVKTFQGNRPYKGGKGRRDHHRIEGEINSSILQNPDEHGRRDLVDQSSHSMTGSAQQVGELQELLKEAGFTGTTGSSVGQFQSPAQEETAPAAPVVAEPVPQVVAPSSEVTQSPEVDVQAAPVAEQPVATAKDAPVVAEGNIAHDPNSRLNRQKKKGKGGRFEGQPYGEQRHRHGQDVLQPADFPPLSTNPATKAVSDIPVGSYRQPYQPRGEQGYFPHKGEAAVDASGQSVAPRGEHGRGPRYNPRSTWQDSGRSRERQEGKPPGVQGEQRRPRNTEQGESRRVYRKDGDRQSQRPHRTQGEPIEMHISLRTTTDSQPEAQQSLSQSAASGVSPQQAISPKAGAHVAKVESVAEKAVVATPASVSQSTSNSNTTSHQSGNTNTNANASANSSANTNIGSKQEKGSEQNQNEVSHTTAPGGKKSYAAVAAKPSAPAAPAVSSAQ